MKTILKILLILLPTIVLGQIETQVPFSPQHNEPGNTCDTTASLATLAVKSFCKYKGSITFVQGIDSFYIYNGTIWRNMKYYAETPGVDIEAANINFTGEIKIKPNIIFPYDTTHTARAFFDIDPERGTGDLDGDSSFVVTDRGYVGIGTTTPLSTLHVNGGVGALSTGITFGDGDSGFHESADDDIIITLGGNVVLQMLGNENYFGPSGSYPMIKSRILATTTVPVFIPQGGDANTGLGWTSADIGSLIAGGVNVANFTADGRLGIGTTTPSEALDVNGDIALQDTLEFKNGLGIHANFSFPCTITPLNTSVIYDSAYSNIAYTAMFVAGDSVFFTVGSDMSTIVGRVISTSLYAISTKKLTIVTTVDLPSTNYTRAYPFGTSYENITLDDVVFDGVAIFNQPIVIVPERTNPVVSAEAILMKDPLGNTIFDVNADHFFGAQNNMYQYGTENVCIAPGGLNDLDVNQDNAFLGSSMMRSVTSPAVNPLSLGNVAIGYGIGQDIASGAIIQQSVFNGAWQHFNGLNSQNRTINIGGAIYGNAPAAAGELDYGVLIGNIIPGMTNLTKDNILIYGQCDEKLLTIHGAHHADSTLSQGSRFAVGRGDDWVVVANFYSGNDTCQLTGNYSDYFKVSDSIFFINVDTVHGAIITAVAPGLPPITTHLKYSPAVPNTNYDTIFRYSYFVAKTNMNAVFQRTAHFEESITLVQETDNDVLIYRDETPLLVSNINSVYFGLNDNLTPATGTENMLLSSRSFQNTTLLGRNAVGGYLNLNAASTNFTSDRNVVWGVGNFINGVVAGNTSNNVVIGINNGDTAKVVNNNVWVGREIYSGIGEKNIDNTLIISAPTIATSNTAQDSTNALIFGNFETRTLTVNGDLAVTGTQTSFGELVDPVDVISTAVAKYYTLTNWTAGKTNNTTLDADSTILLLTAGTYLVNFSFSFTHSNNSVLTHISAFNSTDNTEYTNIETERTIGNGSDIGCVSGTGLITVSANDKVSIRAKADKTGNLTINHGNLNIIKL